MVEVRGETWYDIDATRKRTQTEMSAGGNTYDYPIPHRSISPIPEFLRLPPTLPVLLACPNLSTAVSNVPEWLRPKKDCATKVSESQWHPTSIA